MKKHLLAFITSSLIVVTSVRAQSPDWVWAENIGSRYADGGMDITANATGRIYTVGYFRDTVDFDPGPGAFIMTSDTSNGSIFLSACDSGGNFLWAKQWNNGLYDNSFSVNVDPAGNIYMTGYYTGLVDFDPGPGNYTLPYIFDLKYYIVKLDSAGNFIWVKTFGGCDNTPLCHSKVDQDGNIYSAGMFSQARDFDPGNGVQNLTAPFRDIFILKLDSSGSFAWVKQITGTLNNWPNAIAIDEATNIYLTGSFSGTTDFNPGAGVDTLNAGNAVNLEDVFIAKYNPSGNYLWAKQIGGPFLDRGESIAVDKAGNVITTGDYGSNGPGIDFDPGAGVYLLTDTGFNVFISKLDSGGNFVFAKAICGSSFTNSKALALDDNGNIFYTGSYVDSADFDPGPGTYYLSAGPNMGAVFISELDNAGNFTWAETKGGTYHLGAMQNTGTSLFSDASGNIYFTGRFEDSTITFGADTLISNNPSSPFYTDAFIAKIGKLGTGTDHIAKTGQGIRIYPNPSNGIFMLQCTETAGVLNVYNVMGGKILETRPNGSDFVAIDLQGQASGVYFYEIINNQGVIANGKLVKE